MKRIACIITIILCFLGTTQAQSITQERPSQKLEAKVKAQTNELVKELGLRNKQALEYERLAVQYALLTDEVLQSDLKAKVKTRKIKDLERKRVGATRNIFTKPQYDLYVKMLNENN